MFFPLPMTRSLKCVIIELKKGCDDTDLLEQFAVSFKDFESALPSLCSVRISTLVEVA